MPRNASSRVGFHSLKDISCVTKHLINKSRQRQNGGKIVLKKKVTLASYENSISSFWQNTGYTKLPTQVLTDISNILPPDVFARLEKKCIKICHRFSNHQLSPWYILGLQISSILIHNNYCGSLNISWASSMYPVYRIGGDTMSV